MHRPPAYNIPGVPAAPVGRKFLVAVDRYFLEKKKELSERIPLLTKEEVAKRKNPYHVVILHEMMMEGYFHAVHELNKILRKEETEIKAGIFKGTSLLDQKEKFYRVVEVLKFCQDYAKEENFEAAALLRMEMGESLLKANDTWLAKHFLFSTLKETRKMGIADETHRMKIQAEIHCLLAFIVRDNASNLGEALESAISHLVVARELSRDQPWQFKMHTITIKLKKPIGIHGLRDEYEIIDGSSMSLYYISTLLEHEMLIGLANEILLHHKYLTENELKQSRMFADKALQLAYEVLHPVALNSALLRFGIVLRQAGEYEEALGYFTQLAHHAEVTTDQESLAIANHNIALCELGRRQALKAVISFVKQKTIAAMFQLHDLEADALKELGRLLLSEGQLSEAELCFEIALEKFRKLKVNQEHTQIYEHLNMCLIMRAITAGHKLWSRFAGVAKIDSYDNLRGLVNWKLNRKPLPAVARPNYEPEYVEDVMEKFWEQDSQKPPKSSVHASEDSRPPSARPSQVKFPEHYNLDDELDKETYLSDFEPAPTVLSSELKIEEDEEVEESTAAIKKSKLLSQTSTKFSSSSGPALKSHQSTRLFASKSKKLRTVTSSKLARKKKSKLNKHKGSKHKPTKTVTSTKAIQDVQETEEDEEEAYYENEE